MAQLGLVAILVDLVVVVLGVTSSVSAADTCHVKGELSYRNRTCWLVVCEDWL